MNANTLAPVGIFTDMVLYGIIVPVVPFILRDRLNLPQSDIQHWTSTLLSCFSGASLVCSLPAGIITDNLSSRKLPFITGLVSLFLSTLIFAIGPSLPWLVLGRILQGVSGAVIWTVGLTLIMDTVGSNNLGATIGTIFSIVNVGELAAPLTGGLLYKAAGSLGVFGVSATLITIDFIFRLALIEKKAAAEYGVVDDIPTTLDDEETPSEESPLLANKVDLAEWILAPKEPRWFKYFPIFYCFRNPQLLTALLFTFMQATVLGTFDSTLPTEAQALYGFDSLQAGLLFAPLIIPSLILGFFAGRAVDTYGTKPISVIGMAYLTVSLNLLRIPKPSYEGHAEIVKLCIILAVNSVGVTLLGAPSLVEASNVIENYHKANKDLFGEKGPYAQLYAINSMVFNAGLTFGPMIAGVLREK